MIDKLIDWTFDLLIVDLMIDLLCTHILAHRWVARRLFKFKFNLKGKALLSTIASWCSVVVFYGMMSIFSLKWLENKHNCCCICALTRVFSVLIDEGQRLRAFFFNVDNQDTGTISLSDLQHNTNVDRVTVQVSVDRVAQWCQFVMYNFDSTYSVVK